MRDLGINAKCSVRNDALETRALKNWVETAYLLTENFREKFFINMVTQEAKMEAGDSTLVFSYSVPLPFTTPARSGMNFGI